MIQLNEILGKESPMELLNFFLEYSKQEFSETEVRKKTKLARATVNKWLKILLNLNLLTQTTKGKMKIYKANTEFVVTRQLKILLNIVKLLPHIGDIKNVQIYLYGSAARGEDLEDSDIDLLIIGKPDKSIFDYIETIEAKVGRRVKMSFYTELEWSSMARKDPAFYERVEKDKIRLI
jgi:predicted nucleotidyltransferase